MDPTLNKEAFIQAALKEFGKLAADSYGDTKMIAKLKELLHGVFLKTR